MNIIIRPASPDDFTAVLSLIKEFATFQKTPEKVITSLGQMTAEKDFFRCIVAESSNGEIVAFATYFFAYYSWSGKALYLDDLYVTAPFRKQSIGKMLLDNIIGIAKREHCKKLRWQVSGWNTNAIDFYIKMGAVVDETEINCDLMLATKINSSQVN